VLKFHAESDPSAEVIAQAASLAPINPFYTLPFVKCQQDFGSRPWVLTLREQDHILSACTAFTRNGRLNNSLEIHSLPILPPGEVFWRGLVEFCRETDISFLEVNSAASPEAHIPTLQGETRRTQRNEYIWYLKDIDLWKNLRKDHMTKIRLARRSGLAMRRARDIEACVEHCRVIGASMERRKSRGEVVSGQADVESYMPFLERGAGLLFQVTANNEVLSSDLILLASKGAYGHSIGTSTDGRRCGASHFLEYEIAMALQAEGMEVFNLGGTSDHQPGLANFKAGFGAKGIELQRAQFYLGTKLKRTLTAGVALLRKAFKSTADRVPYSVAR